ncbi:hypothetical protein RN001_004756 [Aquatica leii]|uniref:Uncharacterized protein n=1 Tax=Aquatica leii TaxID=1421715 RepID=A0AAN7Q0B1_9COLE|nr:hypothetical protein RN001_004756 [Aquatica leii]
MDIYENEEDEQQISEKGNLKNGMHADSQQWFSDTKWTNIKCIYHEYLPTFPKRLKKDQKLNIELPYPIYSSNLDLCIENVWNPFQPKSDKTNTRLNYYRKLYKNSKKKLLVKDLQRTVVSVPKYIIDLAANSAVKNFDDVWCYNGGLLDCLDINKSLHLFYVNSPNKINCINVNKHNLVSVIEVNNSLPIYNIKCSFIENIPILGVRQRSRISLFQPFIKKPNNKSVWSKTSEQSFVDMELNCAKQICTLDNLHRLKIEDMVNNKAALDYNFPMDDSTLTDSLASILFQDANTLVFMNRCCIYLLDLRSKTTKIKCLKDGLACDDLCTLSKKNSNTLYISSMHNILEFDIKSMNCSNKVMHLMTAPPFVSSLAEFNEETCLCLMSRDGKVLMHTEDQQLCLPQYVPKIADTLTKMCSVVKLDNLNVMDERLTFPIAGMKLHTDPVTHDLRILTFNTAGDIFQQRLLNDSSTFTDPIDTLENWTRKLSTKPKNLEVTSICNLNKLFHSVTTKFPDKEYFQKLMKEGTGENFVEKNIHTIQNDIKSKVGEVMNTLWDDDDDITTAEENIVSSQSKVIEWLQSNI